MNGAARAAQIRSDPVCSPREVRKHPPGSWAIGYQGAGIRLSVTNATDAVKRWKRGRASSITCRTRRSMSSQIAPGACGVEAGRVVEIVPGFVALPASAMPAQPRRRCCSAEVRSSRHPDAQPGGSWPLRPYPAHQPGSADLSPALLATPNSSTDRSQRLHLERSAPTGRAVSRTSTKFRNSMSDTPSASSVRPRLTDRRADPVRLRWL